MCDCLRQLWLLTHKNLILSRRNKVWTLFEVILPIIFLLPVTLLVVRGGTVQLSPGSSFEPVPLEGGAEDITIYEAFSSIQERWCDRGHVLIAYSTQENHDSVEDLMNELAARFSNSSVKVDVVYIKDETHLLDELRADAPNSSDFGCCINKYAGGVIFNQFDTEAAKLDYKLLVPAGTSIFDDWYLDEEWDEPFEIDESGYR
ncbi:unnamed protein product [Haemonchus placei]|uniref:ABC transporter family protein n=1 Tax=Haemonchus placei TaxID=6290 RepID=A0A0N4WPL3_HAEPC|nr:unnamed protein product [Haemonchus placei]